MSLSTSTVTVYTHCRSTGGMMWNCMATALAICPCKARPYFPRGSLRWQLLQHCSVQIIKIISMSSAQTSRDTCKLYAFCLCARAMHWSFFMSFQELSNFSLQEYLLKGQSRCQDKERRNQSMHCDRNYAFEWGQVDVRTTFMATDAVVIKWIAVQWTGGLLLTCETQRLGASHNGAGPGPQQM